jgi:DNA replication protein DnaD
MKNNYWMKLWFDILRDPKMGMLPDRLWRRVIELFLIAGQYGEDGLLPDVSTMAWQLNKSVPAILSDLQRIANTGIVSEDEDGRWLVTNFKKRNEPVDGMKRIKDFRMRERYENSNENVTEVKRECNADVTMRYQEAEEQKNRGTEAEKIKGASAFAGKNAGIYSLFEDISPVTEQVVKLLDSAVEVYSEAWVKDAIAEGVKYQATKFSYVSKILSTWKAKGRNGRKGVEPKVGHTYEEWKKMEAENKAKGLPPPSFCP